MRFSLLDDPATAERMLRPYILGFVGLSIVFALSINSAALEAPSFFALLTISLVCRRIFDLRRVPGDAVYRGRARIWFLISLGFLYLALDEALSFHERIDQFIHWALSIEETDLTDRLDDLIVLVYGIVGLAFLYLHRSEFSGLRGYFRFLIAGFAFLFVMVVLDTMSNRPNILLPLGVAESSLRTIKYWLGYGEEFFKLLAEVMFLLGFLRIYRQVGEERQRVNAPVA